MSASIIMKQILFIIPISCSSNLFAQTNNKYKFIEPNISISYDSNNFRQETRYSNTFYETETYDLSFGADTPHKGNVQIRAGLPVEYPSRQTMDSFLLAGLEQMKAIQNDTFSIVAMDKKVRDINGFLCVGVTGYNKKTKEYGTSITGFHFSDNDYTELILMSPGNNLDKEYILLTNFLGGFKSYSAKEIESEEALIKNKYTVLVTPLSTVIENFQYRPKTYTGVVSTTQALEHRVAEVQLERSTGKEIFSPDKDGQVPIISNDEEKGTVTKKGELVLLNSFGKKVKLPFTFTYQNNGSLQ